jgi:hypothetical protein
VIPKILNLYWGKNRPLSFMRYMTVVSFINLNPEWEVIVYVPSESDIHRGFNWDTIEHRTSFIYNGPDHLEKLKRYHSVEIVEENFEWVDLSEKFSEIHKSDILRWKLLSEGKGFWSDFDILFLNPMPKLFTEYDFVICSHPNKSNVQVSRIGFIGGGGNAGYIFESLLEESMKRVSKSNNSKDYQSLGRFIFDKCIGNFDFELCNGYNFPINLLYPIASIGRISLLYRNMARSVSSDQLGIHWFGGHPDSAKFESRIIDGKSLKANSRLFLFKYMCEIFMGFDCEVQLSNAIL